MPGLTRAEHVARLACERAGRSLGDHGVVLDTVEASGENEVTAVLHHGEHRITVAFVLAGDDERDADAVVEVLRRPPDTWDARWSGTTDETRDVRPGIAGPRWRMAQG